MAIWMAAMLAAAALQSQEDRLPRALQSDDGPRKVEGFVGVRAGAWCSRDFSFKAVRLDSTQASSDQQALFSASIYGGLQVYEHLAVMVSYEADIASKITSSVGGAFLGWREHPKERYGKGVPDEVLLYAGVVAGRISIDSDDFGGFERSVGFGGGLMLGWSLSRHWTVQLIGEYRYLRFDYERDVLSGDDSIGGNSVWVGLGLDLRF
jgi:hypothetical protein